MFVEPITPQHTRAPELPSALLSSVPPLKYTQLIMNRFFKVTKTNPFRDRQDLDEPQWYGPRLNEDRSNASTCPQCQSWPRRSHRQSGFRGRLCISIKLLDNGLSDIQSYCLPRCFS